MPYDNRSAAVLPQAVAAGLRSRVPSRDPRFRHCLQQGLPPINGPPAGFNAQACRGKERSSRPPTIHSVRDAARRGRGSVDLLTTPDTTQRINPIRLVAMAMAAVASCARRLSLTHTEALSNGAQQYPQQLGSDFARLILDDAKKSQATRKSMRIIRRFQKRPCAPQCGSMWFRSGTATGRIRTGDLRFTKPLLCQLSYGGVSISIACAGVYAIP